ncbi:hypothetical protein MM300_19205 [Evansella sp. LMS18]|uniref:hypothetical protein n=1 Tax=Evansella sp. LMS18 TaxID=2924033 RepID=UPI0020D12E6E|nr:hypothetical protein [Evansella sp. LMS18]UTR09984.1 hypothetical protein MM300_19205 [Evansella sp. LMS18]
MKYIILLILLMGGCSQVPDVDVNDALSVWREDFKNHDHVDTVVAAFNGTEREIKLRVMVENDLTKEEAIVLFDDMKDSFIMVADEPDIWNYFHGSFDIKSYDTGVLYEASLIPGEEPDIVSY